MDATDSSIKKLPINRRRHLKVKTGCVTCKVRRVKCDEQRPSCLRCIKSGYHCDGYSPPEKCTRPQRPKTSLPPKAHNLRLYPILPKVPSLSQFENEEESRYFEVFSANTAYEIFPNVEMGRLRLMFLQACDSHDSIRHFTIALGALDMTSQASQTQIQAARGKYGNTTIHHYQHAIKEYARAVKFAQMEGKRDFQTALMNCLAILSFEGWLGNHEVAVQQIQIGTKLLKDWKERYRERISPGYPTPASTDEVIFLSDIFTRLSVQMKAPKTNESPQSSASYPLPPPKTDVPELLERIPKSFSTLADADNFHKVIIRFAVIFAAQGLPRVARSSSLTGAYAVGAIDGIIPPDIVKAQATLIESLRRWITAFTAFKNDHEFKAVDEKKASLTLELHMKSTYIGTIKTLAQDELVFDNFYDIYRDIVTLSEALLNCSNASKASKFCFDAGVILPLWYTGHKCRDIMLRRRVISLLLQFPRREGVWDSVFAGRVIECIRGFEEEYMENGKVPEWARIRSTSFDVDLEKRTVQVKCEQRLSATSDELVIRWKTVDYYVHTRMSLEHFGTSIMSVGFLF